MRPLHVLLLADDAHPSRAVQDHIGSIVRGSRHHVVLANPHVDFRARTFLEWLDLERFDALALHYSLYGLEPHWLNPRLVEKVARFTGPKLQFLQDEYRRPDLVSRRLLELGVHTLLTLVDQAQVERAYPLLVGIRKVTTLCGYVHDDLVSVSSTPIAARRRHLGYRSRATPFALGALAQDKVRIAAGAQARAAAQGLVVDLSVREEDRIYGPAWLEFVGGSKAVLGTESGASIWDHDGRVEEAVEAHLRRHPDATFEEVSRDVLAPHEGNLDYSAVSPRVFEAAAMRTAMVNFPGRYSGVLEPERHYIPLEKDFSNFDEVARRLRDDAYLQALADRTHAELIASGRFSSRRLAAEFDQALDETAAVVGVRRAGRAPGLHGRLAATTTAMRRAWELPLGELALPLVHEASLLLEPDRGPLRLRARKAAARLPLQVALSGPRAAEYLTRGLRLRLRRALGGA